MKQQRTAWIPWVLALVALLGLNAISRDDPRLRRNDAFDGVGLSLAAKDLEATGRASDPLVFGPPPPLSDAALHDLGGEFLNLEIGGNFKPAALRPGAVQGRAPPVCA